MNNLKIKVCMVSGDYPPIKGGLADYTKCLFDELKKRINKNNVFLITSKEAKKENKNIINEIKKWNLWGIIKTVIIIKKNKPNIVHIQYPTAQYKKNISINFLPLLLKTFTSIPIILTIHEFSNKSIYGRLRIMPMIMFSNKTIIVSEEYRSDILKLAWPLKKYLNKKIIYIPIGPNIAFKNIEFSKKEIQEIKKSLKIKIDDFVICFFGWITKGKGIEFLLETFQELIKNQYSNLKLLFIGDQEKNFFNQIKLTIKKYKLESKIVFTGYCSPTDVSKYMMISDMCVEPFEDGIKSKRGSFLVPLFHKLPIVTTKSDFIPEGLIDYENVILINYGNKEQLKKAILDLLKNPALKHQISQNTKNILHLYSWETITKRIIELYVQCLKK